MRDLVLSNGNILLALDGELCLRDFYYPFVGSSNHIGGQKCRLGIWVEEQFQWVERPRWQIHPGYVPGSLVSDSTAESAALGLRLRIRQGIHFQENLYLERITVRNQLARARQIRLFLAHDFSIQETPAADTVFADPATRAIIHYEGNTYFLIGGSSRQGGIAEFATGIKGVAWAEGTWRDAEDGHLQGNPIAEGSVDSAVAFHLSLPAGGEETLDVWIAVGESLEAVRQADAAIRHRTVPRLLDETDAFWRSWLGRIGAPGVGSPPEGGGAPSHSHHAPFGDLPVGIVDLFSRSLLIMRAQIDNHGAVIAATDSEHLHAHRDTYNYMWPREGALAALGLDRLGYSEITRRFFEFCAENLSGDGYLWHKYTSSGAMGPSSLPWIIDGKAEPPIPEDETALVLHALWQHHWKHRDVAWGFAIYQQMVRPAADFLARYRDPRTHLPLPSWDIWEERRGIFALTAAAVYAGLVAAASFARVVGAGEDAARYSLAAGEIRAAVEEHLYDEARGRFLRRVTPQEDGTLAPDPTLDSSLYGLWAFGMLPVNDARIVRTMEAVYEALRVQTEIGGIARYAGDSNWRQGIDTAVVPGNPWFTCTLWFSQWQIARARTFEELHAALPGLEWACRHATRAGLLAEQVHPYSGHPLSVCPFTASHTAFVLTVLDYLEKLAHLRVHTKTGNGRDPAGYTHAREGTP